MPPTPMRRARSDDDDSEEPTPKKKRRAKEETDDDEPVGKRKKKKNSRGWVLALLIGSGVSLLLCCTCGAGVGGYFLLSPPPIVGSWEAEANAGFGRIVFDFERNNTGKATVTLQKIGGQDTVVQHFSYLYKSGRPATLEIRVNRIEAKNALAPIIEAAMKQQLNQPQRFEVEFRDNTMLVKTPGAVVPGVWRRIR